MRDVRSTTAGGPFLQAITIGPHALVGDEKPEKGGEDQGPEPHEFLLAALASCTSMTIRAYARHKQLPLRSVDVRVRGRHDESGYVIEKDVRLEGDLDDAQRARMLEIGGRCPVARTLSGTIRIEAATLQG
jgi:putative redox protein